MFSDEKLKGIREYLSGEKAVTQICDKMAVQAKIRIIFTVLR